MKHSEDQLLLKLLLKAGQLLLESGAETYRAEDAAFYMFQALGHGKISTFAAPTVLILEIHTEDGDTISGVKRIRRRATHLGKIEEINNVVRQVAGGELGAEEALSALLAIDKTPDGHLFPNLCATAMAAGAFSLLLGGGWKEFLLAFACNLAAQGAGLFFRNVSMYQFFNSLLGGMIPALITMLACHLMPGLDQQTIVIGAMLPLFPGVATINAIRDAINGDLVSGVSRAAEVVMIAVGLGFGASIVYIPGVIG